jgi:APA family basic amino acid/polyamine antiporter
VARQAALLGSRAQLVASQLLRTKSIDALIEASEDPSHRLRKSLGPWSITALGIGAVIGSGIFTLTGTAAAGKVEKIESILHATLLDLILHGPHAGSMLGRPGAGPAITLSFGLVAVVCFFAALCYAELASMIPIAGSAYTYAYAILGEIFAWIIGWDLILEYAVSNMSVAVGFSAYIQDLAENLFGLRLPDVIAYPMFSAPGQPHGIFNIPALLITMLVTWVLVRGVKESAQTNGVMVAIKIVAIVILHWIRFGFDRGGGMPQASARSAYWDYCDVDCVHDSVRGGFAGAYGHRALPDFEYGFAGGGRFEASGI